MKDRNCTQTSMYDFVFRRYEEKKDLIALCFLHKKFTYRRLKEEIDCFARAFIKYGLKKGDVITLALPNIPTAVSAFYGANKIGLVVSLFHPLAPYSQLRDSMQKTGSKLLFSMDVVLDCYFKEAIADGFKIVCCKAEDWLKFPESAAVALFGKKRCKNIKKHQNLLFARDFAKLGTEVFEVAQDYSPDETRIIMPSGGTTSLPKSVTLTSCNFNTIAYFTIAVISGQAGKVPGGNKAMIAALPMFHCFGLGVTFHMMFVNDFQAVLIPKYRPKAIIRAMRKNKDVTLISGVPTMFIGIVGQKNFKGKYLARMEHAFCGGDKLSPALKKRFDEAMISCGSPCRLDEGYGLTEASGVISVNRRNIEREGSVGKVLGEYFVEAFDTETNALLERGQSGQLCVSGDVVMKGYFDGDNADAFFECGGKKFVKTGDFGTVDADGYIFMKTRIKRVLKVSGVNVYPAEAESVIYKADGVSECCVIGRAHEYKGCETVAFVVAGEKADKAALEKAIKKLCVRELNKWTVPKKIIFIDKMPTTILGKTDVNELEKML